jgi:hypothetical protein
MSIEKSHKFDRHSNVKDILASMDKDIPDININSRRRFSVKVADKYVYRDLKNPNKRYSVSEKINYFYSEVEAREAFRFFSNQKPVLLEDNIT